MLLKDLTLRLHAELNGSWGQWTGLKCGDWWFCNSIEHADWRSDPVAPWACWHCCQPWCCQHGLARVVTEDEHIVWMTPYYSTEKHNPFRTLRSEQLIVRRALMSRTIWDGLATRTDGMQSSSEFPRITSHDLIHMWLQERPRCAVPAEWDSFPRYMNMNSVTSHPLDKTAAVAIVQTILDELHCPPVVL